MRCGSALVMMMALTAGAVRAEKVFVAPLTVGAGADPGVTAIIDERLLTSLRRIPGYESVGASDVRAIMDIEASRQASGCADGIACAAELADALDAPQMMTGQLGRVGNTWILSLTRLERTSMSVLARTTREAVGDTPAVLLPAIDGAVDELFGIGPNVPLIGAGVGGGVAVVSLGLGVGFGLWSWAVFNDANDALIASNDPDASATIRTDAQNLGNGLNAGAITFVVVGGIAAVVGASLGTVALLGGGS